MSYILLPKESIVVGGWFGKDGQSEPFAVDVDGWWGQLEFIGVQNPSRILHYAIEIDSNEEDKNIDEIGMVDGVIRFISDRPNYDGGISSPSPSWGPNENLSGSILTKWFTGFLSKNSLDNLSRNVNLEITGDYGNISNFKFSIRNDTKYWKLLEDNEKIGRAHV